MTQKVDYRADHRAIFLRKGMSKKEMNYLCESRNNPQTRQALAQSHYFEFVCITNHSLHQTVALHPQYRSASSAKEDTKSSLPPAEWTETLRHGE